MYTGVKHDIHIRRYLCRLIVTRVNLHTLTGHLRPPPTVFVGYAQYLVFCGPLFVVLSFFILSLYCLSLQVKITLFDIFIPWNIINQ